MPKVLVTDYVHPLLLEGLEQLGYHVVYAPEIPRNVALGCISAFEGMLVNTRMKLDREHFEQASALKFVGRLGVGLDIFDLDAAEEFGVRVLNTPGANANAVAEHALGLILALVRNVQRASRQVKDFSWLREANRGIELKGRKLGIIGFGNTGSALASKLSGWGLEVLAHDKYKRDYAKHLPFVRESTLEHVMAESDILSLHVPLTDETLYMVNDQFLSATKRGLVLINTARGKVVDTRALLDALESGHVSAAGLDVLENEKPDTYEQEERDVLNKLARMENVILTPHIAGWTVESKEQIARQMLEQVSRVAEL